MEREHRKRERVTLGFHIMHSSDLTSAPSHARWENPVFDVVLVNDSNSTSVVSALGLEAVDVWTKLKGLPTAFEIRLLKKYSLPLKSLSRGDCVTLRLPKPVGIPAQGGVFRFQLHLDNFTKALQGNQSLVRLTATMDGLLWRSRKIYLGTF